MVSSLVSMFKKLKFGTDENLGWGPVHLPEIELQTTAYWLMLVRRPTVVACGPGRCSAGRRAGDPGRRRVLLMVDREIWVWSARSARPTTGPDDLSVRGVPAGWYGGRLFQRHDELVPGRPT